VIAGEAKRRKRAKPRQPVAARSFGRRDRHLYSELPPRSVLAAAEGRALSPSARWFTKKPWPASVFSTGAGAFSKRKMNVD
jgi:hypothetical protein